jgi:hypothetical protein
MGKTSPLRAVLIGVATLAAWEVLRPVIRNLMGNLST